MTNLEALRESSAIFANIPDGKLYFQLARQNLAPAEDYNPENDKQIDLATAGLLLFVATQPQSVKELDYQITNVSASDLLAIRSGILSKYGIADEMNPDKDSIIDKTYLW